MINLAIIGATGHTGEELIDLLLKHPQVRIRKLYNTSPKPQVISEVFPKFKNKIDLVCSKPDIKEIREKCDLVFLALPHTVSMGFVPKILKAGKRIIDLSADYRLKNTAVYEKFYQVKHKDAVNLKNAVYGLPEIYRAKIKNAKLVANPGCYPTAAILALAPLVSLNLIETDSVIIDAKSGVSGAGKKISRDFLFSEINENFRAYKINIHQHIPEINQVLSKLAVKKMKVTFVPHLLPLNRGILETIYVRKNSPPEAGLPTAEKFKIQNSKFKNQNLIELYKKFYKTEQFVRIKKEGEFPRIKDVAGTNFCDIGIKDEGDRVIIVTAIDNLLKGASGQAVQNMNIMYKFPETMGLL
ncbi:MAG: N-acetyl-gamma-glutamyl-phosphate reductase [Candidatus Omnitrophota bacterium]